LRRGLTESTVHDSSRLGVLERRLLLETSLLGERWLLLEASRLRGKGVRQT
jgi:hypothetical protein